MFKLQSQDLHEKFRMMQKQKACNKLIFKVVGFLTTLGFLLISVPLFALVHEDGHLIAEKLPMLKPVISFIHSTFMLRRDVGIIIRIIMCVGLIIIPSVVVSFLMKLICFKIISTRIKRKNETECDVCDLEKEAYSLAQDIRSDSDLFGFGWALLTGACLFGIIFSSVTESPTNILLGILFFVIWEAISCFLLGYLVFQPLLFVVSYFRLTKAEIEYLKKIKDQKIEQEQREQEELERKCAEEKRKKQEEKQAKEKAERLQKGRDLYEQATVGEEINEELMQEAADLGEPNACFYIGGKKIYNLEDCTTSEMKEKYNCAKPYFKTAAEAGFRDGAFLYYSAVMITESFTYEKAYDLLKKLRSIDQHDLSDELQAAYSTALKQLIELVNSLEEKNRNPAVRHCHCVFFNAGICNKLSSSTTIIHCNYVSNPGNCSTALLSEGLKFE